MKVDILDLLPAEAVKKVDEHGYAFLEEQGYDTKNADRYPKKRRKLRQALKRNGHVLKYTGMISKEKQAILVWFELWQRGKMAVRSTGVKFIMRKEGDANDQGEG